MGWLAGLFGGGSAAVGADAAARADAWRRAFDQGGLPDFVRDRLAGAGGSGRPWVATMTPAELRLVRSHGLRPLATVSGTCWFHYGWSWTEGHAEGWHRALDRIRQEARAAGANAVLDVRMRTINQRIGASMDFTLIGTAVRLKGLKPSPDPVIATVPALEFLRLIEMGIVPVGIAVGARYEWITDNWGMMAGMAFTSQPLGTLSAFWESIRRDAHAELRRNAAAQGNGVLAHTHFGQLLRREQEKQPTRYLGRHIVIGTVVEVERGAGVPHGIEPVVDMRDGRSPLKGGSDGRHTSYGTDEQEREALI